MLRTPIAAVVLCCLGACAVGPDYVRPAVPVPGTFVNGQENGAASSRDAAQFWAAYQDPTLSALVNQALAANKDIKISMASLREARGLRGEVRGDFFPKVDLDASVGRDRLSLTQLPGTTIRQRTNTVSDIGFDSAWEIDLFGGVRRSVEAANAGVGAADADLAAMRISVSAETAREYFELRGYQTRLRVARDNLKNQSDTLNVISIRFNAGRVTDFDVSRARFLVETTRATIPSLEASIARTSYALAVLTGQPPGALSSLLDDAQGQSATPPPFVADDPSALLRRRPDIAAAERRVAGATASIGVNTAELFPTVTLIGAVGVEATHGNDLSKSNALRYTVGPSLSWNLLDFGRIRGRIEQANARYDGALATYEKTVLTALQDAEGALVTVRRTNERVVAVSAATDAARSAAHLATLRFNAGATDLLDLLDAQRQVLSAEDQLSDVETARQVASVALFKAMGGAWAAPGV